ncbi:MAG: hypothetical protein IKU84_01885 [Clostridia bacterium]|nr:hypothetical protein [Clostridia bacterium]
MKKVLVIALLSLSIVANCVAFASDTTTDTTISETQTVEKARLEKAEHPEKTERPEKPKKPVKEDAPVKPEAPQKPEKPEMPAKPETEDSTTTEKENTDDTIAEKTGDTTDETVSEDDTTEETGNKDEKPEKKPMDKKGFREKKAEMKKEKPERKEYMNGIKGLFKHCDKEARDELLDEIAKDKKAENDDSVDTFIDGEAVDYEKYDNIKPIIHKGSALVPVRAVTEAYGAEVKWDDDTKTITITKDETVIVLQIGSLTGSVNGESKELAVAPEICKGRTLVPIRFVAEAFGLDVDWDNDSRTIVVE